MTSIRLEHLQLEGSPNEIRRSGSTSSRQSALLPADRGKAAYQFLLASFLLEVFIWGYAYSFTTTLLYLEVSRQGQWIEGRRLSLSRPVSDLPFADTRAMEQREHDSTSSSRHYTTRLAVHFAVCRKVSSRNLADPWLRILAFLEAL